MSNPVADGSKGGLKRTMAGETLYQALRRHCQSAQPGELIAGERDLALTHGVCRVTVRKVISRLVEDGLLVRRHGKGTFISDRAISSRWAHQIIFTDDFPNLVHPYATSLLSGVLHQSEPGIRIQAAHFRGYLTDPVNRPLLDDIRRTETDGLILPALDAALYQVLKSANPGLRMVFTSSGVSLPDVAGVTWDRFDCGIQALRHLRGQGAARLLFVHLPGGKRLVMDGARYEAGSGSPSVTVDELSEDRNATTARRILESKPDGLAFTDDLQARDILRDLDNLSPGFSRRVPVIVLTNAGFDILPRHIARLEVNGYEIGTIAMATLKSLLSGGSAPGANIGIKVKLVAPEMAVAPESKIRRKERRS